MEWDSFKLTAFMNHYAISVHTISKVTNIPISVLYKLKSGTYYVENKYNELLTAYLEAVKKGRVRELQEMIKYYENFDI